MPSAGQGKRKKSLAQLLQERLQIPADQLAQDIHEQQNTPMLLGELLLERGLISRKELVSVLEQITHVPYVDARYVTIEKAVLKLIPRAMAERCSVLPLGREGNGIVVVMADPQNLAQLDDLRFLTGGEILPRFGFRSEIAEAVARCYDSQQADGGVSFVEQVDVSDLQFFTASSSERNKAALEEFEAQMRQERTPAVRLVSAILAAAAAKKASDIHIEPQPLGTVVRIRVDGVLRELTHIPADLTSFLVSRIKILADMDIAERRVPQDGRFLVETRQGRLDLRVSTLPTHEGEKVVMRLLDPAATRVAFPSLGLGAQEAGALSAVLGAPQGMLLVTGPTGSGKSTTLYAALNFLRSPALNITTIEDPIEYRIDDINQVQVNPKAGLTFANTLRSMLRQDPNVIMVGEVRDQETAEIALQAAQTGHMVLSTLHTTDSIGAITRLLDLGVPAFLIASSVTAVLAQRLVRRLCSCAEQVPATAEYAARLMAVGATEIDPMMYRPVGCARCDNSGYRGRLGIYELLLIDDPIRASIRSTAGASEIRNLARYSGMRLLQEDALEKVKLGVTTLEEALRVVPFDATPGMRCRSCSRALAQEFLFCPFCGEGARQTNRGHLHYPDLASWNQAPHLA